MQEEGFQAWVKRHHGVIRKLWKITETATRSDERKVFKEVVAYAKKHASEISGLLFYKVDR